MSPAGTPGKRDFTRLYTAPDPRPYVGYFAGLDYRVLGSGARFFRRVMTCLDGHGPVADVCCSYGQDAALLNHHLDVDELFAHWSDPAAAGLDRDELLARDREFFARRRRADAVDLVGLDASAPAVAYGLDSGLLSAGVAADTETDPTVPLDAMAGVQGVVVTGGIGYVGENTFAALLDAAEGEPWVAGMVLRWVDLEPLAELFRGRGYTVQVAWRHPVVQRRVVDRSEQQAMLAALRRLGRDPGPLELAGFHAAVAFLATPSDAVAPDVDELAAGLEDPENDPGTDPGADPG